MTINRSILESVIQSGKFSLERVTEIIETGYLSGDYSAADREALLSMRDLYLTPESQQPELLETYARLEEKYAALEARIAALEQAGGNPPAPEEYPAWQPWDGVSSGYPYGAKVSHKGVNYHSEYQGNNTWEPGALGTEALWVVDAGEADHAQ